MQVRTGGPWAGDWTEQMTPAVVRAINHVQHGRCSVTGQPFCLPEKLPVRQLLSTWVSTLPLGQQGLSPLLVRATTKPAWEPGNLLLICRHLESTYRHCGTAARTADLFRSVGQVSFCIPAADVTADAVRTLHETEYAAWRKLEDQKFIEQLEEN